MFGRIALTGRSGSKVSKESAVWRPRFGNAQRPLCNKVRLFIAFALALCFKIKLWKSMKLMNGFSASFRCLKLNFFFTFSRCIRQIVCIHRSDYSHRLGAGRFDGRLLKFYKFWVYKFGNDTAPAVHRASTVASVRPECKARGIRTSDLPPGRPTERVYPDWQACTQTALSLQIWQASEHR